MDLDEVLKLLELMEAHGLDEIEVEQGETRIRLKKCGAQPIAAPIIAAPVIANNSASAGGANMGTHEAAESSSKESEEDTTEITSPMVGTFYRAPTPDADPFVSEGEEVAPDTVVAIIEAMKLMNEIKAEVAGEVIGILVENGESVEYGQPLMVIRRATPSK